MKVENGIAGDVWVGEKNYSTTAQVLPLLRTLYQGFWHLMGTGVSVSEERRRTGSRGWTSLAAFRYTILCVSLVPARSQIGEWSASPDTSSERGVNKKGVPSAGPYVSAAALRFCERASDGVVVKMRSGVVLPLRA